MRSATCVLWVALLGVAARPTVARADDKAPASYFAVIDRVDLEPSPLGGTKLRVALSALAIGGQLLDLTDPKSIKVTVGGQQLDTPYVLGRYGATDADLAIALVIQTNQAYAEVLPSITATLDQIVLFPLNNRTQLAVLAYGEATSTGKLGPLKSGRRKLRDLVQDASVGEPALLDTIDRALRLLKRAKTTPEGRPLRKLIIVISDGLDRTGDRDRVTQLGTHAERDGVRIHSLGYAPNNVRRPLLTLGELSKKSLGTFRWVVTGGAASWTASLQQLNDEIQKQYVVTYFLPGDAELGGQQLKVATVGRIAMTAKKTLQVPAANCGGEDCPRGYCAQSTCIAPQLATGRGVLGWLLLLAGGTVALLVVLGGIGFVLQTRQQHKAGPAVAPGTIPVPGGVAPPPAPGGPALLVLSGPRVGQRVPMHNGFTIGKAPDSNLVLDDNYTSTHHAQIGVDAQGGCRIYDRNSTNGTFANGARVTDMALDHGMLLRIGSTELQFLAH